MANVKVLKILLLRPVKIAVIRLWLSWNFHGYQLGADVLDLSRVGSRNKLKSRSGDEPHWQRLRPRAFLGYRPAKGEGRGTWFARVYEPDSGKYMRKALGDFGGVERHRIFAIAKAEAEDWARQVEAGGAVVTRLVTVRDACLAYLDERPSSISKGVFRRHVFDDPIATVKLDKLRRHHLSSWRKRLEDAPALVTRSTRGALQTKARSASTINRDMVPLRAALHRILAPGAPGTDAAWQEALKPVRGADRRRELYLDKEQRRAFLSNAENEILPFLRALCQLPLRPGAIANLNCSNFDLRTRTLTIGQDKNGLSRQLTVPSTIAKFLTEAQDGRQGDDPLFSRSNGKPWDKDSWKKPIKNAAFEAGLPKETTAYVLRHSVITDLVRSGLPVLTVAQLSGTSVSMIERHYGHLVRSDAEQALASLEI